MRHHLIFEGAELTGKSWLMSRLYDFLEPKYNRSGYLLDGCHWFNCDLGIYGSRHGKPVIAAYLKIFSELKNKNLLAEKFHLSDLVYSRLHRRREINYGGVEKKLLRLGFKIILVTLPENKKAIRSRIRDRLKIYPHYERILRDPGWYIRQQREYLKEIKRSALPSLTVKTGRLPDQNLVNKILKFIHEK